MEIKMAQIAETNDTATKFSRNVAGVQGAEHDSRLPISSKPMPGMGKTKQVRSEATKADVILKRLAAPKGVSIQMLMEATGWQAHSVRGFLSGTVKKKLGLTVDNEVGKDGTRRYRIAKPSVGG
jgi:hypothetical protein